MTLSRLTLQALAVFYLVLSVSGSLYATSPIQRTVYRAGSAVFLLWRDDGKTPLLRDMGPMTLSLHTSDHSQIVILANDVKPMDTRYAVYLPESLGNDNLTYVIRFISEDPPHTVYTADFKILPPGSEEDAFITSSPVSATTSQDVDLSTTSDSQVLPPLMSTPTPTYLNAPFHNLQTYFAGPVYRPVITLFAANETVVSTLAPTRSSPAQYTVHADPLPGVGRYPVLPDAASVDEGTLDEDIEVDDGDSIGDVGATSARSSAAMSRCSRGKRNALAAALVGLLIILL